jgi:hypothetical protein
MTLRCERSRLDLRGLETRSGGSLRPWSPDHLVSLLVVNGVGLILVCAGWWGASGASTAGKQFGFLNLSLTGLLLAGGANGMWFARGRRVMVLARAEVATHLRRAALSAPAGQLPGSNGDAVPAGLHRRGPLPVTARLTTVSVAERLVAGPGMSYYHAAICLLVAGKEVREAARVEHVRTGRRPCEVCEP